ncbi:MAG: hypothetical protein KDD60_07625, partial [Bdellovibrionales bacterium]|nr:hypothetical protein [Bdellovibrionales bacterium]
DMRQIKSNGSESIVPHPSPQLNKKISTGERLPCLASSSIVGSEEYRPENRSERSCPSAQEWRGMEYRDRQKTLKDLLSPSSSTIPQLPEYISDYTKSGVIFSSSRIADYTLVPFVLSKSDSSWTLGTQTSFVVSPKYLPKQKAVTGGMRTFEIHSDSECGFLVAYKGNPIGIVGITVDYDTLMVIQLQYVRPIVKSHEGQVERTTGARGAMPLNLTEVMVRTAYEFARASGFARLGIQSGEKNQWTQTVATGHGATNYTI